MKIHLFNGLKRVHELRERCLRNGGQYKGIDLETLHQLEKILLDQLPRISASGSTDKEREEIGQLLQENLSAYGHQPPVFSHILEVLYPEPGSRIPPAQTPPAEAILPHSGVPIPPVSSPRLKEEAQKEPDKSSGVLEKVWETFRDELSVNWFLFLGAFLLFGAGIFYTLFWWQQFQSLEQFMLTLCGLLLVASMEWGLRKGMNLIQSPRIFAGILCFSFPMVLSVHLALDPLYFFITLGGSLFLLEPLRRHYAPDFKRLLPAYLLLCLLFPLTSLVTYKFQSLLLIGSGSLFIWLIFLLQKGVQRLPWTLFLSLSWTLFCAYLPVLDPVSSGGILYLFILARVLFPRLENSAHLSFIYGAYGLNLAVCLVAGSHALLYASSLFLVYAIHRANRFDTHPLRSLLGLGLGSILWFLLPSFLELLSIQPSIQQRLFVLPFLIWFQIFWCRRWGVEGISQILVFTWFLLLGVFDYQEGLRVHCAIFAAGLFLVRQKDRRPLIDLEIGLILARGCFRELSPGFAFETLTGIFLCLACLPFARNRSWNPMSRLALVLCFLGSMKAFWHFISIGPSIDWLFWFSAFPGRQIVLPEHLVLKLVIFTITSFLLIVLERRYLAQFLHFFVLETTALIILQWLRPEFGFEFGFLFAQVFILIWMHPCWIRKFSGIRPGESTLVDSIQSYLVLLVFVGSLPGLLLSSVYALPSLLLAKAYHRAQIFYASLGLFLLSLLGLREDLVLSSSLSKISTLPAMFNHPESILASFRSGGIPLWICCVISALFLLGASKNTWTRFLVKTPFWLPGDLRIPAIGFACLALPFWLFHLSSPGLNVAILSLMMLLGLIGAFMLILDLELAGLLLIPVWLGFLWHGPLDGDGRLVEVVISLLLFLILSSRFFATDSSWKLLSLAGFLSLFVVTTEAIVNFVQQNLQIQWILALLVLGAYLYSLRIRAVWGTGLIMLCGILINTIQFSYWGPFLLIAGTVLLLTSLGDRRWLWEGLGSLILISIPLYLISGDTGDALLSLGCLSGFFFMHARVKGWGNLVYLSAALFAMDYFFLKHLGFIQPSGYSSLVLLGLALGLEYLSRRLPESFDVYRHPFEILARILPLISVFKEFSESSNPWIFLAAGLVYEFLQDTSTLSYSRLLGLACYNLALYTLAGNHDLFLELITASMGFSILWYARCIESKVDKSRLQGLKVVGNFLFYSGALYELVFRTQSEHLFFLWGLCILGGWLAIYLQARLQLFSTLLVFFFSVIFFVIRQVLLQVSTGILGIAILGAILLVIGVILEKNKQVLLSWIQKWKARFRTWKD
jgi:hypothetical protein